MSFSPNQPSIRKSTTDPYDATFAATALQTTSPWLSPSRDNFPSSPFYGLVNTVSESMESTTPVNDNDENLGDDNHQYRSPNNKSVQTSLMPTTTTKITTTPITTTSPSSKQSMRGRTMGVGGFLIMDEEEEEESGDFIPESLATFLADAKQTFVQSQMDFLDGTRSPDHQTSRAPEATTSWEAEVVMDFEDEEEIVIEEDENDTRFRGELLQQFDERERVLAKLQQQQQQLQLLQQQKSVPSPIVTSIESGRYQSPPRVTVQASYAVAPVTVGSSPLRSNLSPDKGALLSSKVIDSEKQLENLTTVLVSSRDVDDDPVAWLDEPGFAAPIVNDQRATPRASEANLLNGTPKSSFPVDKELEQRSDPLPKSSPVLEATAITPKRENNHSSTQLIIEKDEPTSTGPVHSYRTLSPNASDILDVDERKDPETSSPINNRSSPPIKIVSDGKLPLQQKSTPSSQISTERCKFEIGTTDPPLCDAASPQELVTNPSHESEVFASVMPQMIISGPLSPDVIKDNVTTETVSNSPKDLHIVAAESPTPHNNIPLDDTKEDSRNESAFLQPFSEEVISSANEHQKQIKTTTPILSELPKLSSTTPIRTPIGYFTVEPSAALHERVNSHHRQTESVSTITTNTSDAKPTLFTLKTAERLARPKHREVPKKLANSPFLRSTSPSTRKSNARFSAVSFSLIAESRAVRTDSLPRKKNRSLFTAASADRLAQRHQQASEKLISPSSPLSKKRSALFTKASADRLSKPRASQRKPSVMKPRLNFTPEAVRRSGKPRFALALLSGSSTKKVTPTKQSRKELSFDAVFDAQNVDIQKIGKNESDPFLSAVSPVKQSRPSLSPSPISKPAVDAALKTQSKVGNSVTKSSAVVKSSKSPVVSSATARTLINSKLSSKKSKRTVTEATQSNEEGMYCLPKPKPDTEKAPDAIRNQKNGESTRKIQEMAKKHQEQRKSIIAAGSGVRSVLNPQSSTKVTKIQSTLHSKDKKVASENVITEAQTKLNGTSVQKKATRRLTIPQAPKFATDARLGPKTVVSNASKDHCDLSSSFVKGLRSEDTSDASVSSVARKSLTIAISPKFSSRLKNKVGVAPVTSRVARPSLAQSSDFLRQGLRDTAVPVVSRSKGPTIPVAPKFHAIKTRQVAKSSEEIELEEIERYKNNPFKASLANATKKSVAPSTNAKNSCSTGTASLPKIAKRTLPITQSLKPRVEDHSNTKKKSVTSSKPEPDTNAPVNFKARPMPTFSDTKRGMVGVPRVIPRPVTTPTPFALTSSRS